MWFRSSTHREAGATGSHPRLREAGAADSHPRLRGGGAADGDPRLGSSGAWWVRHPRLARVGVVLGCVIAAMLAAAVMLKWEERGLRLVLLAGLTAPMGLLAVRRSPWAIPYFLIIVAGNRGLRRLLDYADGEYHTQTVIVLLPLLASLCLGVPFAMRYHGLPRSLRLMFGAYFAAAGWGFVMGGGNGMAAAFELAGYVCPAMVLGYILTSPPTAAVASRWLAWVVAVTVGVTVYGWYQFLTMPPWDEMWMRSALMISIGPWEPMQLRVFSTLASPGPAAMLLALGVLAVVAGATGATSGEGGVTRPRMIPLAAAVGLGGLILTGLLLTRVRATWLMLVVAIGVWAATVPGPRAAKVRSVAWVAVLCGVAGVAGAVLLPLLPGGDKVTGRMETLGSVGTDHSYQERLAFSLEMTREVLARPLGHGLGESGTAVKAGSESDALQVFDNGLLNLGFTLGLPGLALMGFAAWTLGRWLREAAGLTGGEHPASPHVRLGIAVYASSLLALAASNWVREDLAAIVWVLVGIAVAPAVRKAMSHNPPRRYSRVQEVAP